MPRSPRQQADGGPPQGPPAGPLVVFPPDLPPLREVIARHGLSPRKSLGQHFLLDLNLARRIARAAGDLTQGAVVEIGPGPGGLTRALLLEGARRVIAIERDERCVGALSELADAFPGRLQVVSGDALALDPTALAQGESHIRIVANLPYNIATPLLFTWLKKARRYERLTLMFQKEVAARITAAPKCGDYGRLSVMVQWLCRARLLFDVPARAFTPPPKVTSTLVELVPRGRPLAEADPEALETVTGATFGQRRKMLRRSLKSLNVDVGRLLAESRTSATARAEDLAVDEFCALARAYRAQAN